MLLINTIAGTQPISFGNHHPCEQVALSNKSQYSHQIHTNDPVVL